MATEHPSSDSQITVIPELARIWSHRGEIRDWWWVLPLAMLSQPSRLLPWRRPTMIGRFPLTIRLRAGYTVKCRVNEFFQIVELFLLQDYAYPAINYESARTVLDIGANIGVATMWFARFCPQARIFSFEPSISTASRMLWNIDRNRLNGRVTAATFASGRKVELTYLSASDNSELSYTGTEMGDVGEAVWALDLKTLLTIVGGTVDILKLDCEGGEYPLILGADDYALSAVANIVGEYHYTDSETRERFFAHLESAGFNLVHERRSPLDRDEEGLFYAWKDTDQLTAG